MAQLVDPKEDTSRKPREQYEQNGKNAFYSTYDPKH